MNPKKIVFLAADCAPSRWVYHALKEECSFSLVITEPPVSRTTLFRNRIKKTGFFKVSGQALFSLLVVPVLRWKAKKRKAALLNQYQLNSDGFGTEVVHVRSVNDDACLQALEALQPDIVLVNGTRIISKRILQCTSAVFINMHVGITPQYRGSHGGYWAVRNNDLENFGTTIHLVDTGVDTGAIIKQVYTKPAKEDNFTTYPVLQTAIGISALKTEIHKIIAGEYETKKIPEKGKMYFQPTLFEYFFGR